MTDNIPNEAEDTNYGISADRFEVVLLNHPEEQREILRWWYFYGKEKGLNLKKLANTATLSDTTLSRVFRGLYGANLHSVCEKLEKARAVLSEAVDNPDFIMTSLARRMFRAFDRTRALQNVSLMWGDMGIGKTTVCEAYQQLNNHGRTIYVRCGSSMTFSQFVQHLAKSMGVTTKNRGQHELRYKIQRLLRAGQRLLVVDELHQIFLTTRGDTAVKVCEFLRECQDVSRCGLSLIGTDVMEEQFMRGPHKEALAQLVDRGTIQIPLPNKPTKQDVQAFLDHYRLPPLDAKEPEAASIVADIIKSHGLRKLTLHLRDGAANAARLGQPFAWTHFVDAFEDIASLSR
jgi:DNA transposition AAA+ family ATPase